MSQVHTEHSKFFNGLDSLLENGPGGAGADLSPVLSKLEHFVQVGEVEQAENTLRDLATAVGGQNEWQDPFRESGILAFTMQQLRADDRPLPIKRQCLRVIGNCVSDNDVSREMINADLTVLFSCLTVEELELTALVVIFNLCNGFDPAKAAIATLRLDVTISTKLAKDEIPDVALDYVVDLLTWTTEKITAEQFKSTDSVTVFENLLQVALEFDEDHQEEYVAILVHYLQDPEFQQRVANPKLMDDLFALILECESRIGVDDIEAVFHELSISKSDETSSATDTNVTLLSQLISSISGISATDMFARNFDMTSQIVEKIRARLRLQKDTPSDVCAYVILGNLAMSDKVCIDMVKIMELHKPLITTLSSSTYSAILYAAAGLMRHLTFPEINRSILADSGLLQTCCYMLFLPDPSVRGEAAAILYKLATGNFHNIEKMVYDQFTQVSATIPTSRKAGSTLLANIVEQALVASAPLPSTAMKNPMIELGRTVITMLRHLGRPSAEKDVDAVRQEILNVENIARPVARLVRQRFYPDARSEGLLGLGLMAQVPEGATQVVKEFQEDTGLFEAVKELAVGPSNEGQPQQQAPGSGRDYQNAMVLLQAIQNNSAGEMNAELKDQFDALQKDLGKLLAPSTEI